MTKLKTLPHNEPDWKGYTIDELRYMRAYTAARIEINRNHVMAQAKAVKSGTKNVSRGMLGKMLGAFSYLDIAILTWKIGSRAFKAMRMLKR